MVEAKLSFTDPDVSGGMGAGVTTTRTVSGGEGGIAGGGSGSARPSCTCKNLDIGKKNLDLQEINISHLGKRKIIFKMPFLERYVSFLEGI